MTQRDTQFLEVYQQCRYCDQLQYYKDRKKEFEGARSQASLLVMGFMFLASGASILTSVLVSLNIIGWATFCATLVILFPIIATAVSAYDTLYAYERHVKLYEEVVISLHRASVDKPELNSVLSESDYSKELAAYVDEVERVLRTEQGQWAQITKEIQSIDPPFPQA